MIAISIVCLLGWGAVVFLIFLEKTRHEETMQKLKYSQDEYNKFVRIIKDNSKSDSDKISELYFEIDNLPF